MTKNQLYILRKLFGASSQTYASKPSEYPFRKETPEGRFIMQLQLEGIVKIETRGLLHFASATFGEIQK